MDDFYECHKCGKILSTWQCPNGKVPMRHDMDGGVFLPIYPLPVPAEIKVEVSPIV